MSIKKSDRFSKTYLAYLLNVHKFPPDELTYNNTTLSLLGVSNKQDLIPINFDFDHLDLREAVTYGNIGQYIYGAINGDLYDVCLYRGKNLNIYLHGIRTRQLPEVPKTKRVKKSAEA